MKRAVLIVLLLFLFTNFIEKKTNFNDILGCWVYQFSWVNGKKIELQQKCNDPIYKMCFSICRDTITLKQFPSVVRDLRRDNDFKNIKCDRHYLNGKIIETYPVLIKSKKGFIIREYGRKYKGGYLLDTLNSNKMVLRNKQNIFHVYCKKR